MRALVLLLVLAGCGMNSYRPAISSHQTQEQYEADLKSCIQYSKDVRSIPDFGKSMVIGAFGPAGYVALDATKDKNDNYFKDGYQLTDECLVSKGYTLTKN